MRAGIGIVLANSWITCFSGTQIICHFWREIYCLRLQSAKCRDANLRLFGKKSQSHDLSDLSKFGRT